MMNYTKMINHAMLVMLAVGALALSGAHAVQAQEVSTSYKGAGRDPFVKYKPRVKKKVVAKNVPVPVTPPSIHNRIEAYKAQKLAAMNAQQPAPKPTTALLLNEAQVTGIFRTPRGYAAMIEATPIKLSYVIYPGETFYDGMLVAIEENRLVFRRETRWTDGRRDITVEMKPLGQTNAVKDSMTANSGPPPAESAPGASASSKNKAEQSSASEPR